MSVENQSTCIDIDSQMSVSETDRVAQAGKLDDDSVARKLDDDNCVAQARKLDLETDSNSVARARKFDLVSKFYEFMGDCYIEYNLKKTVIQQTFVDYFLYKLYYNYGVKRSYLFTKDSGPQDATDTTDATATSEQSTSPYVILYYVKSLKGYKTNDPITQLCRHLILDTTNMKILSLGIPKAIKFDDFLQRNSITPSDIATCFINNDQGERDKIKYRVYKFPEGTMITYNPSMQRLNTATITSQNDAHDNDNEEGDTIKEQQMLAEENVKQQFTEFLKYATRKKVGTSCFTGNKTFATMFEENNTICNTNLDNIPTELIEDTVLVFNIEHPENPMIGNTVRNFNTLCAVYRLKGHVSANAEWANIINITFNEENISDIKAAFTVLGTGMVTSIHVANFKKQVIQYGVNLNLPEVISSFEKQNTDITDGSNTRVVVPIDQVNIEQLINIVNTKGKHFQGFIIYGINGERTKIVNPKYRELKELKGNKPITLEPGNIKNLFFIYWKLMTENKIEAFLNEFQNDAYCHGANNYINIFKWLSGCVQYFARILCNTYQAAFVKHTLPKMNIPYAMKPLCGELHKVYLATKLPTSISMVEQFMFTLPAGKVFWRIFGSTQTIIPMQQVQQVQQEAVDVSQSVQIGNLVV